MDAITFSYPLARISGLPVSRLNRCFDSQINAYLELFINYSNYLERKKVELTQSLYEAISIEQSPDLRNNLLTIKRDIFNNRKTKTIPYNELKTSLSKKLEKYFQEQAKHTKNIEHFECYYYKVLDFERNNLRTLFDEFPLKNALLLSSHVLLDNIENRQTKRRKKSNQADATMYKYASRACFKTSPFSTLTSVGITKFSSNSNESLLSAKTTKRSDDIKFNSLIFRQLIICMKANNQFRSIFFVTLNSTIIRKEKYYEFLINKYNKETFQKLTCNEVVDYIYSTLSKKKKKYRLKDLLNVLNSKIEGNISQIELYLLELINYGFLMIDIGISEVDIRWEYKLLTFMKKNKVEESFLSCFELMIKKKEIYQKRKSTAIRKKAIKSIHNLYKETIYSLLESTCYRIKRDKGVFFFYRQQFNHSIILDYSFKEIEVEDLLYEDVRRDIKLNIPFEEINKIVNTYNSLIQEVKLFKLQNLEAYRMTSFYKKTYDASENIELKRFYEDYFKNKYSQQLINEKSINKEKEDLPEQITKTNFYKSKWREKLKDKNLKADDKFCFHFSSLLVKELIDNSNIKKDDENRQNSLGTFIQFYFDENEKKIMAVCGSVFPGYGKLYSRFLDILSKNLLNEIKRFNNLLLSDGEIFAENTDSVVFNANIHPPILDYEINIPGGNNLRKEKSQISISDIEVHYNGTTEKLEFVHKKTKKTISIIDLSFQGSNNRSNLFQLMDAFSKGENIGNSYLSILNEVLGIDILLKNYPDQKIKHYPRIIYDKQIIVQRKIWIIPQEALPVINSEKNFESHLTINNWRKELELPDEVFIRIGKRSDIFNQKREIGQRQDDYKPQYINFNSPLSVVYFGKLSRKVKQNFTVEEMLPNSSQLMSIDNEQTVTEFLIQWNNEEKRPK